MRTLPSIRITLSVVIAVLAFASAQPASAYTYAVLHDFYVGEFGSPGLDGFIPRGGLTLSGSTLYGTTIYGGMSGDNPMAWNQGVLFRIDANGTNYGLPHVFTGPVLDAANPLGNLVRSGSTLYGMSRGGGAGFSGTVFKVETDGTGLTLLHSFPSGDTQKPPEQGALVLSGSTLYGLTGGGGAHGAGTLFQVNTDGSGYSVAHDFDGTTGGCSPVGGLTLSGSTFYGMTYEGGASDAGAIFKVNADGSGFDVLHSFAGGVADGGHPISGLTLSGATLYGMTFEGGANGLGTIFRMDTDGTDFAVLHSFGDVGDDGQLPRGALIVSGSTLYGATTAGGLHGEGTAFAISTDGSGFNVLHSFESLTGSGPDGPLALYGNTLYGTTSGGGLYGGGTVFALEVPEPATLSLVALGLGGVWFARRCKGR